MTIEKIIKMSADDWDKMTDDMLLEWAKTYFHVTKPPEKTLEQQAMKVNGTHKKKTSGAPSADELRKTLERIEQMRKLAGI